MWPELLKHLARYESAVLNWRDADSYPFSVRCRPLPAEARQILLLDLSEHLPLRAGPASLLCHYHDEQLWRQTSVLVRGELVFADEGWHFRPLQLIPGIEQNPVAFLRFLITCRRKAAAYLKARGLPRPTIPWDKINAVKAKALEQG